MPISLTAWYNIIWFSSGTSVSSTNKSDRHDITEILLKVALNTIPPPWLFRFCVMFCKPLFVLSSFFFWLMHCLSFFELRLLITPFGIVKPFLHIKWLTRRVSLVEQLLTLPEHLSSPPVVSGVRVTRSLALCLCVYFVDRCLFFCPFSFGQCVVCPSIYVFWLPNWYLQALLVWQTPINW